MMILSALVIGCGRISGGFDSDRKSEVLSGAGWPLSHAGALARCEGVTVSACVDPDDRARALFQEEWGITSGYRALQDVNVPEAGFDIITIAAPTALHSQMVDQALALRPKAIFLEKPVSQSPAETEAVVHACREAGVLLLVNYSRRWDDKLQGLLRDIRDGVHGKLRSVVVVYNKGILNNGSHMLDLLLTLCGDLTPLWAAFSSPAQVTDECDPDVDAVLRSRDGVLCHLVSTQAADFSQFELQILTEHGEFRILDSGFRWSIRTADESPDFPGYRRLAREHHEDGGYPPVMQNAFNELTELTRAGIRVHSSADAAVRTESLCDQIKRLAYENC